MFIVSRALHLLQTGVLMGPRRRLAMQIACLVALCASHVPAAPRLVSLGVAALPYALAAPFVDFVTLDEYAQWTAGALASLGVWRRRRRRRRRQERSWAVLNTGHTVLQASLCSSAAGWN